MTDMIRIPFNDVFFYGVALRAREDSPVESDIFANIVMRYLRTLAPVTNRLYRTAEGSRFEYSYSFIPSRPISWRVIKNKRVIEDIESLSDGKYCLSYYDDQGRDVKRVIFDKGHKWLKTNYYNSIYGNTLLCSVLPKELNGETVILQYLTGATYPVTHFCCKKASCKEVQNRVFERSPIPEISALTNYGILYFATDETLKLYNQILEEEEAKYAEEHKPPVYTTDDDVKSGFGFTSDSFDANVGNVFSLDEALELSDDDSIFDMATPSSDRITFEESPSQSEESLVETEETNSADKTPTLDIDDNKPFDIDENISAVLEIIKDTTNLEIDSSAIFIHSETDISDSTDVFEEEQISVSEIQSDADDALTVSEINKPDNSEPDTLSAEIIEELVVPEEPLQDALVSEEKDFIIDLNSGETDNPEPEVTQNEDNVDLLSMEDEEIDDYVKTLIDSLLNSAQSATEEYANASDEGFETESENIVRTEEIIAYDKHEDLSSADATIESGRDNYYFFGDYSKEKGRNGRGKTLMADGKTAYEGDYKNDMRHGVGAFYYRSGELCYFGSWAENKRSGFGIGFNSDTGISHTGNWVENKPNGIGVRFDRFGNFLYLDSHSEKVNGGIRVTGFTEKSLLVEFWDEKTLGVVKKEIFIDEI